MSDGAAAESAEELATLIEGKDGLKAEMKTTTTDISDQAEVMKTFDQTTLAPVRALAWCAVTRCISVPLFVAVCTRYTFVPHYL